MHECFTSQRDGAIRVTTIRRDGLPGWLGEHPEYRNWLSTVGFKAESGTFSFLPGDSGSTAGVIAAPVEGASVWAFAGLPMSLPEGTYLLDASGGSSPTDIALGWALHSNSTKTQPCDSCCALVDEWRAGYGSRSRNAP